MKYFFDTEFIDDGKTIELISIGVVCEDGRIYYAESNEFDPSRACHWVKENVLPHLTGESKSRAEIASDLTAFMGDSPEIWAYFADYDWVVLCQLYGRMIDVPQTWPNFCRDVKQLAASLGNPKLPKQESQEHNALDDASWTLNAWEFLDKLEREILRDALNA